MLDIVRPLTSRLQIVKWRKENPGVATQPVTRPIFIVGQPRTGTTILFDLLAQDPALRPPLTWEVDHPCPLPRPNYDTTAIAGTQGVIDGRADRPGLLGVPPDGRSLAQECVRITGRRVPRMIFSVQYRLPSYNRWLLYEADHRAGLPAITESSCSTCSLAWPIVAAEVARAPVAHRPLSAEYPDALIVQTHRDPLQRHFVDRRLTTTCDGWRPTTNRESPNGGPIPMRRSSSESSTVR